MYIWLDNLYGAKDGKKDMDIRNQMPLCFESIYPRHMPSSGWKKKREMPCRTRYKLL